MKTRIKKAAKNAAKATIVAMAAITGIETTNAAAQAAMQDMSDELGAENVYSLEYTWDPFDGMLA